MSAEGAYAPLSGPCLRCPDDVPIEQTWVAMKPTDSNGWRCGNGHTWTTPYYSHAMSERDKWERHALAAGWTPPSNESDSGTPS